MTHLIIKQDTGTRETVASGVIKKLYDLAKEIELDANGTIALKGWLYTSATYQDYIDYLEDTFKIGDVKLLIIDATKKYLMFEDPTVLSVLATAYGDGIGVTLNELTSVSEILLLFKNNTNITKFNEFKYFTGITTPASYWLSDWFSGCTSLTEITIPKNVRSITEAAFLGCTSLHTVTFDTGSVVESISGFKNCSSLTNIQLPNTVLTLGQDCFEGCISLTTLNTSNIISVDSGAFARAGIISLDLSNVTTIGRYAFQSCTSITSVGNINKITSLGTEALAASNLVINDVSMPYLSFIGDNVFATSKVKLVSNLGLITAVGYRMFYHCYQLTSVTLPLTITSIGYGAFDGDSVLTSINLSNITSIANLAFYGCSGLTSIDISNVTSLGDKTFYGCSGLTLLDFSNVTSISYSGGMLENYTFLNCSALQYAYFPILQSSPLYGLFRGCTSLKLYIAPNITNIYRLNYPFGECTNLKGIFLPKANVGSLSLDVYHNNTLFGGLSVNVVDIGNVTALNEYTMKNSSSLTAFIIRNNTAIPTLTGETSSYFSNVTFYVDDSMLTTYLADSAWSNANIHLDVISNFVLADHLDSDTLALYNSIVNPS